ncbi:MAG: HEAT repeat domain-containing protein [Leptospiraceae bacterium]|nr:HEAT repeat domain-containing protein [Leptospiraceae bacterium]MCP5511384.1 HEAT repeat domain-containing protein [Leptospiraceae bacterium]
METSEKEEEKSSSKKDKPKKGLSEEQISKKKEILTKILKYGSNRERKDAMREVIHFPPEHSLELYQLISNILITDNDMGVKITCLRTLAEVKYTAEPQNIISSLEDKSEDVKEAAIFTIQKLKIEQSSPDLLKLIKNQDFTKHQRLTSNAITAISELESGKDASEFLETKFKEKTTNTNLRASIALFFGKVKDPRAENALIETALDESEDPMTRAYSVNALAKMNSQKSIEKIKSVLDKINETKSKLEVKRLSNLKIYCIAALVTLGDTEILKDLISYAKDDDPNVRLRAIKQLAEINNPEVFELIDYKANRDPSRKVQEVAKKLLEEMKKRYNPGETKTGENGSGEAEIKKADAK